MKTDFDRISKILDKKEAFEADNKYVIPLIDEYVKSHKETEYSYKKIINNIKIFFLNFFISICFLFFSFYMLFTIHVALAAFYFLLSFVSFLLYYAYDYLSIKFKYTEMKKIKFELNDLNVLDISWNEAVIKLKKYDDKLILMDDEIKDIKACFKIKNYKDILKNKEELNERDFLLLEEWLYSFCEKDRAQRSLKIDKLLDNHFNLIENT